MTTLHWGILGAAQIAESRMIPGIKAATNNTLTAIGSRDLARAQKLAALGDGARTSRQRAVACRLDEGINPQTWKAVPRWVVAHAAPTRHPSEG